jgi:hypothetical protein
MMNYPIIIDKSVLSGGKYGIYSQDFIASVRITQSWINSSSVAGIALMRTNNAPAYENFVLDQLASNNLGGPLLYINGPLTNLTANQIGSESYVTPQPLGDIVYGPNGGGSNSVYTNCSLGIHSQYAVYGVQNYTVFIACNFSSPVFDPNHHAIYIGCAGAGVP